MNLPDRHERQAVLVLGMHRSGTSAVTRVLSFLGADLPRQLMTPVTGVNSSGFWEPVNLVDLNDELLASAGSFWDDISEFPPSWCASTAARAARAKAVEALREDFAESSFFVLKDPRICRLVPFWIDVLREFQVEPYFVIPIRNPLAVAASLKARNGFLPAKAHLLWLRHLLEAERHTRNYSRSFLMYEHLLEDWRPVLARVSRDLDIEWPRRSHQSDMEIEHFISRNLSHHEYSAADVEAHIEVPGGVKRAYGELIEAISQKDMRQTGIFDVFDGIRAELDRADRIFGPLVNEGRFQDLKIQALNQQLSEHEAQRTARSKEEKELRAALIRQHREIERLGSDLGATHNQAAALHQQVLLLDGQMKTTRDEVTYWNERWRRANEEIDQLKIELLDRNTYGPAERVAVEYSDPQTHAARLENKVDVLGNKVDLLESKVNFFKKIPFAERIWRFWNPG